MRYLVLIAILLIVWKGCAADEAAVRSAKAAEEARIQREVARRVEVVQKEAAKRVEDAENDIAARQPRLHTIRVIGFIVLAGGAVAGLLWLRQPPVRTQPETSTGLEPARLPQWTDHYPPSAGRVIDLPSRNRPAPPPQPRRWLQGPLKSRNHHETPRHP